MNLLVSDTGPLNYLIQIEAVDLLNDIASEIIIPASVLKELRNDQAPRVVRLWAETPPEWLIVVEDPDVQSDPSSALSKTDLAVITLACQRKSILLMDDRNGREMARSMKVTVIGTVGILLVAAEWELVDFPAAMSRLQSTSIFLSPKIIQEAWTRYEAMKSH
ncbi:MAG: hypothetical protein JJU29_19485 [Verrucomicrobia bacterium]|nr:hypothetical protein [Verrucomicrobiota bacterium]MCH8514092.1 hypothetical protein [Kiritimatiellia bacterium]